MLIKSLQRLKFIHLAIILSALIGLTLIGQAGYIKVKAELAQYMLDSSWNKSISDTDVLFVQLAETGAKDNQVNKKPENSSPMLSSSFKPWPWADFSAIAKLNVPRLGIQQLVLSDSSGRSLAFGPGHVTASVQPGQMGNSVISGHRDTHFRFLEDLRLGDQFTIQRKDRRVYTFEVVEKRIVEDHSQLSLDSDKPLLTLLTCYPFDGMAGEASQRILVIATLKEHQPTFVRSYSKIQELDGNRWLL